MYSEAAEETSAAEWATFQQFLPSGDYERIREMADEVDKAERKASISVYFPGEATRASFVHHAIAFTFDSSQH